MIHCILGKGIEEKEHEVLRRRYLLIYGLGALGDWLQGPYVYRLYSLHNLKGLFLKYQRKITNNFRIG